MCERAQISSRYSRVGRRGGRWAGRGEKSKPPCVRDVRDMRILGRACVLSLQRQVFSKEEGERGDLEPSLDVPDRLQGSSKEWEWKITFLRFPGFDSESGAMVVVVVSASISRTGNTHTHTQTERTLVVVCLEAYILCHQQPLQKQAGVRDREKEAEKEGAKVRLEVENARDKGCWAESRSRKG